MKSITFIAMLGSGVETLPKKSTEAAPCSNDTMNTKMISLLEPDFEVKNDQRPLASGRVIKYRCNANKNIR